MVGLDHLKTLLQPQQVCDCGLSLSPPKSVPSAGSHPRAGSCSMHSWEFPIHPPQDQSHKYPKEPPKQHQPPHPEGIKILPWVLSVPQDSPGKEEGDEERELGKKWGFSDGKVASGTIISHEAQRTAWRQTKGGNKAFGMLMPPKKTRIHPPGTRAVRKDSAPLLLFPPHFPKKSPRDRKSRTGYEKKALSTTKTSSKKSLWREKRKPTPNPQ